LHGKTTSQKTPKVHCEEEKVAKPSETKKPVGSEDCNKQSKTKNIGRKTLPKELGENKYEQAFEEDKLEEGFEEFDFHISLAKSISQKLRGSIEKKSFEEATLSELQAQVIEESASGSKLPTKDEENISDFEMVSDIQCIFTEADWREFLENPPKELSEIQERRIIWSIKMGLPDRRRGDIWEYLVKVNKYKKKEERSYQDLLNTKDVENIEYTISKDIMRTFPELDQHKEDISTGNNSLFNVLKAYAVFDPDVKY